MKMKRYKLLLVVLLIVGCDEQDNLTSQSSEVDVDWVLVKTLNMESMISSESSNENIDEGGGEGDELNEENDVIGYYFYFTN